MARRGWERGREHPFTRGWPSVPWRKAFVGDPFLPVTDGVCILAFVDGG